MYKNPPKIGGFFILKMHELQTLTVVIKTENIFVVI